MCCVYLYVCKDTKTVHIVYKYIYSIYSVEIVQYNVSVVEGTWKIFCSLILNASECTIPLFSTFHLSCLYKASVAVSIIRAFISLMVLLVACASTYLCFRKEDEEESDHIFT